jgi:hypothetical protein
MDNSLTETRVPKPSTYSILWLIMAPLLCFESFHRLYVHRWGEQITHGFGLFDGLMVAILPIIFCVHLRLLLRSKRKAANG